MHPGFAVLCALVLTLVLMRLRVSLGISFVLGAVSLGLFSGAGVEGTLVHLRDVLVQTETWIFAAVVTAVFVLSAALRRAGHLDVVVTASQGLLKSRRVQLASLPALVGLLPMPGGAVVSAPMVESSAGQLDPLDKNLINYWYRHVWESFWPLYPAVLLAAQILRTPVIYLSALLLPLAVLLLILGYIFVLRRVPAASNEVQDQVTTSGALWRALLPMIVVIAGMPLMGFLISKVSPSHSVAMTGLLVALLCGNAIILLQAGPKSLIGAVRERRTWDLLVLALAVKLFGGLVLATGAAQQTADALLALGVPNVVAALMLPLLVGVVSGNTLVVVTVTFPILFAIAGGSAVPWQSLAPLFVLGYAAGFVGYMISPVHLCLILSSRFFNEPLWRAFTRLALPLTLFLAGAYGLFMIIEGSLSA